MTTTVPSPSSLDAGDFKVADLSLAEFGRKEMRPMPPEIFWSLVYAPLYQLIRFSQEDGGFFRAKPGHPKFKLTDEMRSALNRRADRPVTVEDEETHVHYVDLHPLFLDARGRLDARYTGDGLHLNALGYQRWVEHLKKIRAL